jgi:hypothetical protein
MTTLTYMPPAHDGTDYAGAIAAIDGAIAKIRAHNRAAVVRARRASNLAGAMFAAAMAILLVGGLLESPFGCDAKIRLPLTDAVCVAIGR